MFFTKLSVAQRYHLLLALLLLLTACTSPQPSLKAPTDITLTNHSLAAGAALDSLVGVLITVDDDSDAHNYQLLATENDALFRIAGDELRTNTAVLEKGTYTINVQSEDSTGLSTEKNFVITITGANQLVFFERLGELGFIGQPVSEFRAMNPDRVIIRDKYEQLYFYQKGFNVTSCVTNDRVLFLQMSETHEAAGALQSEAGFGFNSNYSDLLAAHGEPTGSLPFATTITHIYQHPADATTSTSFQFSTQADSQLVAVSVGQGYCP